MKPYYIDQDFQEYEPFKQSALRWNLDFRKIDAGGFNYKLSLIDFGQVQISNTYIESRLKQNGLTPVGFRTFAFSANKKQSFGWLNKSIDSNYLLAFPKNGTIDGYSLKGFHVFTISIKNELLDNVIQEMGAYKAEKKLKLSEFALEIDFNSLQYLRSYMTALFEQARKYPSSLSTEVFANTVLNRTPQMLINYIADGEIETFTKNAKKSDAVLFKSINYLQNQINQKVPIHKMCKDLGISERTLEYVFKTRLGVTPNYFSKSMKLHALRNEMLSTDNSVLVAEVAQKYGITHMGQLSADYKKHFGELPSETKSRRVTSIIL